MKSIPVKIYIIVVTALLGISPTNVNSNNGQPISGAFGIKLGAIYDYKALPHIPDTDPREEDRFISTYLHPLHSGSRVMPRGKSKHFSKYLIQFVNKDGRIFSISARGYTNEREHCLDIASVMLSNLKTKHAISSVKTDRDDNDLRISYTQKRDNKEITLSCRSTYTPYPTRLDVEHRLSIIYSDLLVLRELEKAQLENRAERKKRAEREKSRERKERAERKRRVEREKRIEREIRRELEKRAEPVQL